MRGDADVDRRRFAFVHGAADHAAGVEGELQVGELRRPWRSPGAACWTYSWAEWLAVVRQLDLDDGVHRAGVGRVGGRPVGRDADLADDQSPGRRRSSRGRTVSTSAIRLSVSSMRVPACGADVDLEGAGVHLGEELAAQLRTRARPAPTASATTASADGQQPALHDHGRAGGRSRRCRALISASQRANGRPRAALAADVHARAVL